MAAADAAGMQAHPSLLCSVQRQGKTRARFGLKRSSTCFEINMLLWKSDAPHDITLIATWCICILDFAHELDSSKP